MITAFQDAGPNQSTDMDVVLDRVPTNHPSSDPSRCPGNLSLARPLAQSRSLHEVPTKKRLKTWPRCMAT